MCVILSFSAEASSITLNTIGWFSTSSIGAFAGHELYAKNFSAPPYTLFINESPTFPENGVPIVPGDYSFQFFGTIPQHGSIDYASLVLSITNAETGITMLAWVWTSRGSFTLQPPPDYFFENVVGTPAKGGPVMEDGQYRVTITDFSYNWGQDRAAPYTINPDGYPDMEGYVEFSITSCDRVPDSLGTFGCFTILIPMLIGVFADARRKCGAVSDAFRTSVPRV